MLLKLKCFIKYGHQLKLDLGDGLGRIDDAEALRELGGAAQILAARGEEEIGLLLLEFVERTRGVEAGARHVQRHVEQERQIRLQIRMNPLFQRFHLAEIHAAAGALIGEAGVGEAVGNDPVATRQGRLDDLRDVLAAAGEHQQRLGFQMHFFVQHEKMHLETEALLMFASRREHIAQVIEPALARGDWVISDRFTDASFAYQGAGRGMDLRKMEALEQWVHPDLQPDLTFLFDVPLDVARARLDATRSLDKFEQEQADFFLATRSEYLRRAAQFPQRFRVIDSTQTIAQIQLQLVAILDKTL